MFQDFDQWQHVMDVNCLGVVRCMQAFGPLLGVRDDHAHHQAASSISPALLDKSVGPT